MTIIAADLASGSSPNALRSADYAICIQRSNALSLELKTLPWKELIKLLQEVKPAYFGSDNINELIPQGYTTLDFFNLVPNSTQIVQVTKSEGDKMTKLKKLLAIEGIYSSKKLNPLQTAEVVAFLVSKGYGSRITHISDNNEIFWRPISNNVFVTDNLLLKRWLNPKSPSEFTEKSAIEFLKSHRYISDVYSVVGKGKEAVVALVKSIDATNLVAKLFQFYSPVVRKLNRSDPDTTSKTTPLEMAKKEARNLKNLSHGGVNVPKLVKYEGPLVLMEAIMDDNQKNGSFIAPKMSEINLKQRGDPGSFLESSIDELYLMFKEVHTAHGDYSPQNILLKGDKISVIDVRQAEIYNSNTFTSTPHRMRVDLVFDILKRDLRTMINYFARKYRIYLEIEPILAKFYGTIPLPLQEKFKPVLD